MTNACQEPELDPTYGYDRAALDAVGPPADPPGDFADFWTGLYARASTVDVAPGATGSPVVEGGVLVQPVEFTSLHGIRLGGWLTTPVDRPVRRGLVHGHGYGGRSAPEEIPLLPDAAILYFCARGMPSLSRQPDLPETGAFHVLHGISSRETYVHGGCAADLWCAATALTRLVPEAAQRLDYVGGSFGGGIGALALPWDDRFTAACLSVPSFGNHPLRMTLPCMGSGEAIRRYAVGHPEITEVLAYFDAATAATHLSIPTIVAAALADPGVPPPGQFAVYNALAGPKELFRLTAGHMDYPEAAAEERARREAQRRFLERTAARPGS